jgi:HSP20 family protein
MESNIEKARKRFTVPACSISEESGVVTVRMEMPGVGKQGLEVKVEGNALSVFGERPGPEPRGRYLLRERRAENYQKNLGLLEFEWNDCVECYI